MVVGLVGEGEKIGERPLRSFEAKGNLYEKVGRVGVTRQVEAEATKVSEGIVLWSAVDELTLAQ